MVELHISLVIVFVVHNQRLSNSLTTSHLQNDSLLEQEEQLHANSLLQQEEQQMCTKIEDSRKKKSRHHVIAGG